MSQGRTERRRDAAKRQIMKALDDDTDNMFPHSHLKPAEFLIQTLDGSDSSQVKLLLQDLGDKVLQQQQVLASEAQQGKQEQLGSFYAGMMKLPKSVKSMTVRDFNAAHKCNLLQLIAKTSSTIGGKKRIRPTTGKELETPAPNHNKLVGGKPIATPSRTIARGEAIFSKNGSPVDTVEEGTLVATVAKKRRGGASHTSAVFDINVGEGRYINLTEPGTVECLDGDMKDAAISQLKILQDQMASLMAQLNNNNN